jgi:hypothetical protein
LADLPLILAGPILRRVEPRLVTVWMALSDRRSLVLSLFEGRQQAGTGPGPFTGGTPRTRGAANSLRVGEHLHLAVVLAELPAAQQPLTPGLNYSYNVGLAPFDQGAAEAAKLDPATLTPTADLRSEQLLRDQPIDGKPHKALGYEEGELPGFALPPPALTDLRILHCSCRRPGFVYPVDEDGTKSFDGLAWVDDLILEWRRGSTTELPFDANVRPHQLFFTGDQIYADDVSTPMLPMLNRVANRLIGGPELLPTRYPPKEDDASREAYVDAPKQAGFPTLQAYVDKQRADGKDPLKELKKDRRVRVLEDPCFDRGFQLVYPAPPRSYSVDPGLQLDTDSKGLRYWKADLLHFPAALRGPVLECEAEFSTVDVGNHLVSFGEYCAMYLAVWSNVVWELKPDGKPDLATIDEVYQVPVVALPQIWELYTCIPGEDECVARTDKPGLEAFMKKRREKKGSIRGFKRGIATLEGLYDSLPRVRRALANIPTYMILDDHDVTDDWNIGRAWRDRVHTAPLGRRILTTALATYVVFQDWGNDPLRYGIGSSDYRDLLDQISAYQPRIAANASDTDPEIVAAKRLEELFGLNQPDPETPAPKVTWHFTIDGPRHRVIALDTRTRRSFRSRYLPPGLLSAEALAEQLPSPSDKPLPAGVDALIVITQTPAVLPSLAARVIVPVMSKLDDFRHHEKYRRLTGLEPDNEIWPGDDVAYEAFLRRLAEFKQVVVLSGEVHYAGAGELSYWKKGLKRLMLDASLEADLDTTQKPPIASPRLLAAFTAAGFSLSPVTCVQVRKGNDEWLVVDGRTKQMFVVRKETDGLNVYEEENPARIAQFVSSGIKNIKGDILKLGRLLGFAFQLSDLTPAERLIWDDNTPAPAKPPPGGRFPPAVRDRLGSEPVLLPSGNWPPGTTLFKRPDFSWRADAVRDERPSAERQPFTEPDPLPTFDPKHVEETYAQIADVHAQLLDGKLRFNRGVLYTSNFGLIRFELDEQVLVACQDLYSHPPDRHEGVLVNTYRIPLDVFGLERPKLLFDVPAGSDA